MKKQLSFGNKLLFQVLSTTIIVFGITMFFVTKYSYETSQSDAKKYIEELASKYATEIQSDVDESITISRLLSAKFEAALKTGYPLNEDEVINYASSILHNNSFIVGVWFKVKEKELFFKANMKEAGKGSYDKTGQFNPYITKSGSNIKITPGSPYGEDLEWIKGPMDSKNTYITKPYLYPVEGVEVLMSTVAIPMYHNGEFIGSIGIDITLNTFSKMASSIKVYDNGYSFIVDHFGRILGHPQLKLLNKDLLEVTNNNSDYKVMLQHTKDAKNYMFFKDSLRDGLTSLYFSKFFKIKEIGDNWSFVISAPVDEYLENAIFIRNFSIATGLFGLFIIAGMIIFSVKKLNYNLAEISSGLNEFFEYLNTKTGNPRQIELKTQDEFGVMATSINKNVYTIQKLIEEDNNLIEDVKILANNVSNGYLDKKIEKSTSTKSLNELKELLNNMLNNLENLVGKDLNKISEALSSYTKRDFTLKLDPKSSGKIGNEIIEMNNMITEMLQGNQHDGLSLQDSSVKLSSSTNILNNNATSQAASLEETAASIDEITSNIEQTSHKAQEMLKISRETQSSANEGKTLSNKTVEAMNEINETVNAINDSISVIDQIAFQTNILSLNAAVEAATAGEAGKGFAVVAQEVRNLASRSAEATKQIRELVENATTKANTGKLISANMIESFTQLEKKIADTSNLISDVTDAAKEQTIGMTQISDAVNQLDKFTQENASIADETNSISQDTSTIAERFVNDVEKNKFDGKIN